MSRVVRGFIGAVCMLAVVLAAAFITGNAHAQTPPTTYLRHCSASDSICNAAPGDQVVYGYAPTEQLSAPVVVAGSVFCYHETLGVEDPAPSHNRKSCYVVTTIEAAEPPEPTSSGNPFVLTLQQGSLISGAIAGVWILAWSLRAVRSVLHDDGDNQET